MTVTRWLVTVLRYLLSLVLVVQRDNARD